jgi:UDPglucose 6-dehydrogenase
MEEAKHTLGYKVTYANDAVSAIMGADALILVTEWPEFRLPNWDLVHKSMNEPVIFDGRNIYQPNDMKKRNFTYFGIGLNNKN